MTEETEILGYYGGNVTTPITPTPQGALSTRAIIFCDQCRAMIKSNGGPAFGALCVTCTENKE